MTDTSMHGARMTVTAAGPAARQPANDEAVGRRLTVSGRPITVRLAKEAWAALDEVSAREALSVDELCTRIDVRRGEAPFPTAVRTFVASYLMRTRRDERVWYGPRQLSPVALHETD